MIQFKISNRGKSDIKSYLGISAKGFYIKKNDSSIVSRDVYLKRVTLPLHTGNVYGKLVLLKQVKCLRDNCVNLLVDTLFLVDPRTMNPCKSLDLT